MGEAKRRRDAVARGERDPGLPDPPPKNVLGKTTGRYECTLVGQGPSLSFERLNTERGVLLVPDSPKVTPPSPPPDPPPIIVSAHTERRARRSVPLMSILALAMLGVPGDPRSR